MDWMKVQKSTAQKPEVLEIAAVLGITPDDAFGKLFRVWSWADDNTQDGNAVGVTFALLDSIVGVTGFANAMHGVGWLEQLERSQSSTRGGVRFVNFDRHNGQTAKARALTATRVAKHKRQRAATGNAKGNAASVTSALPREDKRREEDISLGDKSPEKKPEGKPKANQFIPPTIAEVREFCENRTNGIDPVKFVAHYQARGWELSKGRKMKDWRACVVTWERNDAEGKREPPSQYPILG